MKTVSRIGAALVALLVTALAYAQTSPDAALDALHDAGFNANQTAFIALLADDAVFLGVADGVRLQGESVRDFVSESFSRGEGWAFRSSDREVRMSADGSVAWFDESLLQDGLGSGRGTGVLVRDGQNWKVVQYNLTVPLDDSVAESPSGLQGFFTPQESSPGTSAKPECKKKRHKTNNRSDC